MSFISRPPYRCGREYEVASLPSKSHSVFFQLYGLRMNRDDEFIIYLYLIKNAIVQLS